MTTVDFLVLAIVAMGVTLLFGADSSAEAGTTLTRFDVTCRVKGGIVPANNKGFEETFSGPFSRVNEIRKFSIDLGRMNYQNKSWRNSTVTRINRHDESAILLRKDYRLIEFISIDGTRYYLRDKMTAHNSYVLNGVCQTARFSGFSGGPFKGVNR
jgi:hypothetical protein